MASSIIPSSITNITEYPNSFKRQGAFPLERYSVFTSLEGEGSAKEYASSNPIAYVGQHLVVVEEGTVAAYIIASESGDLVRLAATTESGDLSADIIALQNRVGSLETRMSTLETNYNTLTAADTALQEEIEELQSTLDDQATAIAGNTSNISEVSGKLSTLESAVGNKVSTISGGNGVTVGGSASEPVIGIKIDTIEGNVLENSEDGLKVIIPDAVDYSITLTSDDSEAGKVYTFTQNDVTIGTINVPKDMVVQSGTLVTDPDGELPGKYIELTLANATSDKIYINVTDLLDEKPVAKDEDTDTIAVTVRDDSGAYKISASLKSNSVVSDHITASAVTTAKIADKAVTTAKLADNSVEKSKLSSDVQSSLGLADTALQGEDVSLVSGDTNGTVKLTVGETTTEVAVTGLSQAAYKSVASAVNTTDEGLVPASAVAAYVADAIAVRRYE